MAASVAALFTPSSGGAFVRTRTTSGAPIAWSSPPVEIVFHEPITDNPDLSTGALGRALDASATSWTRAAAAVGARTNIGAATALDADVGLDGRNVVVWRLAGYCDVDAHLDDPACVLRASAATTTVFFVDRPNDPEEGKILEADIQLNAVNVAFDDSGDPRREDLQAALTHELGHVLGLDHTCSTSPGTTTLIDDRGRHVMTCEPVERLPDDVTRATMFAIVPIGEQRKRQLADDEVEAMRAIYGARPPPRSAGCATHVAAPEDLAQSLGLAAILIVGLVAYRRRTVMKMSALPPAIALAALMSPAHANGDDRRATTSMILHSSVVLYGSTLAVSARWQGGQIVSDVDVAVDTVLKGTTESRIVLRAAGGSVDGIGMRVAGLPVFRPGQRSLLFLTREGSAEAPVYRVVDGDRGKVDLAGGTPPP